MKSASMNIIHKASANVKKQQGNRTKKVQTKDKIRHSCIVHQPARRVKASAMAISSYGSEFSVRTSLLAGGVFPTELVLVGLESRSSCRRSTTGPDSVLYCLYFEGVRTSDVRFCVHEYLLFR